MVEGLPSVWGGGGVSRFLPNKVKVMVPAMGVFMSQCHRSQEDVTWTHAALSCKLHLKTPIREALAYMRLRKPGQSVLTTSTPFKQSQVTTQKVNPRQAQLCPKKVQKSIQFKGEPTLTRSHQSKKIPPTSKKHYFYGWVSFQLQRPFCGGTQMPFE